MMITGPAATGPVNNPSGSMTNMEAVVVVVIPLIGATGVSAAVAVSVSLTASATATVGIDAVAVTITTGVSISGSAVSCATTGSDPSRLRSWGTRPPPCVEDRKAKRSPNQPKPAPVRRMKQRMATNGNRMSVANPRR